MSHNLVITSWTSLVAVVLLTTGQALHADDKTPVPEGYKKVPLQGGGYILTPKEAAPHKEVFGGTTPDKYDPSSYDLSHTNSMANKQFSPSTVAFSKNDASLDARGQNTFITKPYADVSRTDSAALKQNTKFSTSTSHGATANDSDFNRTFPTPSSTMGRNELNTFATTASPDQGHEAAFTSPKSNPFTSDPMAKKQYLGPGAQKIPEELKHKESSMNWQVNGLPNRPLTIDEVRNLINHGFMPNTDSEPESASKPLNDPNYKPEPLRESPAPVTEDDGRNDAVPPPGTMAQPPPENAESLPQH